MDGSSDFYRAARQREEEERLAAISDDVKKRQRTRIRTQHVKQVIGRITSSRNFAHQQTSAQLKSAWEEIVGPELSELTQVGVIQRKVLQVTVASSVIAQELEFAKQEIVQALQVELPNAAIRDVRFRVGLLTR